MFRIAIYCAIIRNKPKPELKMNKTIKIASSRPGTGKTWTACKVAREWIAKGKRVLFVVPTKLLAHEVYTELSDCNPLKIESQPNDPSIAKLNKHLHPAELTPLIVCQHAAFHRCSKKNLRHWIVIVDELPNHIQVHPTPVASNQLSVFQYLGVDNEKKMFIKTGCVRKLIKHVRDFEKGGTKANSVSLLSAAAYRICKAVIDKSDVYVSDYGNNQSLIYYAEESGFLQRFSHCKEVHLLSATWDGSLFEWFATAQGFITSESILTPSPPPEHQQNIRIIPLLSQNQCSKNVLESLAPINNNEKSSVQIRNIQVIANMVSKHIGNNDKCLAFVHDWANLDEPKNFIMCKLDSRGLNSYINESNVLCLFHGNPLPTAGRVFEALAKKYLGCQKSLIEAWKRTHLYERTLQNIYRCSLRTRNSLTEVNLYVQDELVADYLTRTYLPTAKIDNSLVKEYKSPKKRGRAGEPEEPAAIALLEQGMKPSKVAEQTGISVQKIYEYKRKLKAAA